MGLDFGKEGGPPSIFPHSVETDTGSGQERVGQATVIVSLDGSGDTDDIQEAINLLPPTGGMVFIKEGTFIIRNEIDVNKNNLTIQGIGDGTVLQMKKEFANNAAVFDIATQQDIILRDFKIDGNASQTQTTHQGIEIAFSTNVRVDNVTIENMEGGEGIKTLTSTQITITNCNITGVNESSFSGISITGGTTIVSNNQISACIDDGIVVESGKGITIVGNICKDNEGIGINIKGAAAGQASNKELIVSGNVCDGNLNDGIAILRYNNSTIVGNVSTNNGAYGIDLGEAAGNIADRIIVSANITLGNSSGQIRDNATNTLPNGAMGTTNLALDDLNIIA